LLNFYENRTNCLFLIKTVTLFRNRHNDEILSDSDFEKSMVDYFTLEFNMITHGRDSLFGMEVIQ
jgi:hypothetical protein